MFKCTECGNESPQPLIARGGKMCVQLETENGIIETLGELRRLVGPENIVIDKIFPQDTKRSDLDCLCPIDIVATCHKAGFKVSGRFEGTNYDYRVWK